MNKRVIITGVSGFIGESLADYFSRHGFDVTGVSIVDVHDTPYTVRTIAYRARDLADLVSEVQPTVLVHAAGSASVGESVIHPHQDFENSVDLFQAVLEGVRESGLRPRVVFLSSAAVYGNPDRLPVMESAELKPISPYGFHKVLCEILAREYSSCFGIPTLAARLFSVFGPRQKRLLLWELFHQFQSSSEVIVEGTGNESRDYLYIDDLARMIITSLPSLNDGHTVLNIASGRSVTVKEIAELIKEHMGSANPIIYQRKVRTGDPAKWQADISRYVELTGNRQSTEFIQQLKWTLEQWQK